MLIAENVSITSATLTSIACDLKKNINGDGFDTPYDPAGFRRCVWLVQQSPESGIHPKNVKMSSGIQRCPQ